MMKQIVADKLEIGLSIALLLTFLLNIKKVLVPDVLVETALFNEYLDISIYLFDGVFLVWLIYIILNHKIIILSIFRRVFHHARNAAHNAAGGVEHSLRCFVVLIACIITWQWVSVFQADQIPLAIRHALTMSEIEIIVLVQLLRLFHVEQLRISKNVPRGTITFLWDAVLKILIYFALFNAFIVFIQISTGHSTGLKYLGESILQVGNPGVATISLFGEKILRGYGLFPHPNILAAFLGLTLLALLIKNVPRGTLLPTKHVGRTEKMFHVEQSSNIVTKPMFHVEQLATGMIIMALILTFSRTGMLLTLIASLLIVPRGTISRIVRYRLEKMFHVEQSLKNHKNKMLHVEHCAIILMVILLIGVFFTLSKSFSERELSLVEYSELIAFQSTGNGVGSYGAHLYSQIESVNDWSIQPIHNYFLLTYYELGFIGLFLVIFLLINLITQRKNTQMFHVEQSEKVSIKKLFHVEHVQKQNRGGRLAIIFFLTTFALGDHFFYTIPQGQAIFWLGVLMAIIVPRGTIPKEGE